jgi:hypothetical protein
VRALPLGPSAGIAAVALNGLGVTELDGIEHDSAETPMRVKRPD